MALPLANTAEGQADETTVSAANSGSGSGDAFDAVNIGTNGVFKFDTAHAAHGSSGYRISTGANSVTAYGAWTTSLGSVTTVYGRAYLYLTANPVGAALGPFRGLDSGAGQIARVGIKTNGIIEVRNAANTVIATGSVAITLNAWIRLEFKIVSHASAGVVEIKLFNTPDSVTADDTISGTGANTGGGAIAEFRYGLNAATVNCPAFWMDDLQINGTAYPGPAVTNATASPSVVAAIGGVAAVTAKGASIAAPAVVAGVGGVAAVTAKGAAVATPAAVAAVGAIATVTAQGTAVVTPAVVAAVAGVAAVTAQGASIASPAVVAAVAAIATPTFVGTAVATPAVVAATAGVSLVTAQGAAVVAPGVVAAIAATPAVTVQGAGVAAPATVVALVFLTTPPTIPFATTLAANTTGADVTVPLPIGWAVNDIFLLAVETRNETVTIPTGYTVMGDSPQATGGTSDDDTTLTLFWRRATVSESDPVVSIGGSGHHLLASMMLIRGCTVLTPVPIGPTNGGSEATPDGTLVVPGDTTTANNRLVVVIATQGFVEEESTPYQNWANADLLNFAYVETASLNHTVPPWYHGIAWAAGIKRIAGTFGDTTATVATSVKKAYIVVAMLPIRTTGIGTAIAKPTTVAGVASVPAVTAFASVNGSATPSVVAGLASVPAVTARGAAVTSPSVVAALASISAVSAQGGAIASPAAVAALASIPAVTSLGGAIATPSVVAALASIPAVSGLGTAITTPSVVAALAAVPNVTAAGGTIAMPAVVAAVAAVGAVTAMGAAVGSPSVVAALASIPAVTARGAAVVTPSVVAALASIPAVTAAGTTVASPAVVAALASIPAVTATGTAVVTPATVAALANVPAVSAQGGARALPGTIGAIANVPTPNTTASAAATPTTVPAVASVGTVSGQGSAVVSPATVVVLAAIAQVLAQGGGRALPATVAAVAGIPNVIAIGTAGTFFELIISLADAATSPVLRDHSSPILLLETVMRYIRLHDNSQDASITDSSGGRVIIRDG